MRRRQFIQLTGWALTAMGSSSPVRAQTSGKVAVVIGVDRAGQLPKLSAAASGAREMAAWLRSEDFDVVLLTDETSPVETRHVKSAIRAHLDTGAATMLVVYFAGHGFINNLSEFWLLSGAPDDADEAINLSGSCLLAHRCAVPNVVVISDACRSAPDEFGLSGVQGSLIFPNIGRSAIAGVNVDQFLATRIGEAAYEDRLAGSAARFHGLFTTSFLSAYQNPTPDMVDEIDGRKVVPNRRLKKYLLSDLPRRAQETGILLRQLPDTIVNSDDNVYIGRARVSTAQPTSTTSITTPDDFASRDILGLGPASTGGGRPELSRAFDYVATKRDYLSVPSVPTASSDMNSVVMIVGSGGIDEIRANAGLEIAPPTNSDGDTVIVEVVNARSVAFSVGIRFADGSGTVIAGLPRHDATVVVRQEGVASIAYTKRDGSVDTEKLKGLQAGVAAAASIGAFRLATDSASVKFAEEIRETGGNDPALGVLAAYAHVQAGQLDQLASLAETSRSDIETTIFDVAMLAAFAGMGTPPGMTDPSAQIAVPFCPMLSQGWNFLEAAGATVPEQFERARRHLRQALWTTFDREGMDIVLAAPDWRR